MMIAHPLITLLPYILFLPYKENPVDSFSLMSSPLLTFPCSRNGEIFAKPPSPHSAPFPEYPNPFFPRYRKVAIKGMRETCLQQQLINCIGVYVAWLYDEYKSL